jgi:hypothetical protein
MTFDPHTDEIAARVTYAVAYDLLAQAGFTKDERGRWAHEDGRWTWQADEAFTWALVDIAQGLDRAVTVRRTRHTIVYEHDELKTVLAEVVRVRGEWHTCRYHPHIDDPDYDEWGEDRAAAIRAATSHARELAIAI